MVLKYPVFYSTAYIFLILILSACDNNIKEYKSQCNDGHTFKRVSFTNLMDSLSFYDKQYVEVSGKFKQDKDESALFDDSITTGKTGNDALWVDFSQDCPLYLTGTRIGFFDYDHNNGQLTPVNNAIITLRGEIDFNNKGHRKAYKGAIGKISYVKI